MNHSPSTVGKANDLSQPLLSPRLAERKLPAVPHIHTLVTEKNKNKKQTKKTKQKHNNTRYYELMPQLLAPPPSRTHSLVLTTVLYTVVIKCTAGTLE